jgi:cytochrome c peroxidase
MSIILKFSLISIGCLFILLFVNAGRNYPPKEMGNTVTYFTVKCKDFEASLHALKESVAAVDSSKSSSLVIAKKALEDARRKYKQIEFFVEYFEPFYSNIYNRPNTIEVEEPNPEYIEPIGLQVIESLLFNFHPGSKKLLMEQADILLNDAKDLGSLVYLVPVTNPQVMESIRLEIIRIMALGITGYDTQELKTGIKESYIALQAVKEVLRPFIATAGKPYADSVNYYLEKSVQLLKANTDFASFNRLAFLTGAALPLQMHLGKMISQLGLELNTSPVLNYRATNLFSNDFLNINAFPNGSSPSNKYRIQLGKMLFSDPVLSGNGKRSCASCHQPGNYFSDQLVKNTTINDSSLLPRNTPSLFYAAFQHKQFLDARSNNLEEQVKAVVTDKSEMNGNIAISLNRIAGKQVYRELLKKAYPETNITDTISFNLVANAIADFVRSMAPRSSAFDKYMAGQKNALSGRQVNGFNLFMGKAKCGTCHFAPLFNGLLPPAYNISELENIGTPLNENLAKPLLDNDSGHYAVMPDKLNIGLFKTPTVRNAAVTGPYMHNGAFSTLQRVVEFYNKGGGAGIGLTVDNQTLSSKPLHLSNTEIKDIVSFMNALTDNMIVAN